MLRRGAVLELRRTATGGSMCVLAVGASRLFIAARCAMLNGGANRLACARLEQGRNAARQARLGFAVVHELCVGPRFRARLHN